MIGETLSHYRIDAKLGEGGMGEVYAAEDIQLGRRVALKILPAQMEDKPERLQRFRREAKAVASLNHPNIVTLYSVEEVEGRTFLTMELVQGEPLTHLVRPGGMPLPRFLEIAFQLADALIAAHDRGITHRDLKPANAMVGADGRLKVLDFGLAKLHEDSSAGDQQATAAYTQNLTEAGSLLGTMPYMSPEQVQGQPVDHRTDIFALGIMFYELVTGERPFRGDSSAQLISSILRDAPGEVGEGRSDLPGHLSRVIRRCLEKAPERRFQSVRDLRLELEEIEREAGRGDVEEKRPPSVAVLPFLNMSPDPEQDYFCEGIAEDIINGLGRLESLRVASRTSSFQYKGASSDVREIGRRLDVSSILEGSVRKSGNRLRITAQLVNVEDGYRLWSERYDRQLEDVFTIQDEISESIVKALELTLSPKERRAMRNVATQNVEAYEYYLRGRKFFYQMNEKSFHYARQMYAKAIQLDPAFALSYAGIADCCSFLFMYAESSEANRREADFNSQRALELDPDLAEAHASRGLALTIAKDYEGAEAEFEDAIRRNAKLYEAYYFYGRNCQAQGRFEKAIELFEKASELRPEDYQAPRLMTQALVSMGAPRARVEAAARKTLQIVEGRIELNPDDARAFYFGATSLVELGQRERGLEWGRRALAIDPSDPLIAYNVACVFSLAGESDDAMELLEKAVDNGFGYKEWIEHDSDFEPLRADPRYAALLARM
ncbi:MAG TPA: protein kinase [Thermoanaerobaculia bacterium]|nr:protein kinase [Thermoanaerobaculia bacterium]